MEIRVKQRLVGVSVLMGLIVIVALILVSGRNRQIAKAHKVVSKKPATTIPIVEPENPNTAELAKTNKPHNKSKLDKVQTQGFVTLQASWAVQVASFSDYTNAKRFKKQLTQRGFHPYLKVVKTKHGQLVQVFVGPEVSLVKAKRLLAKLEAMFHLKGFVVRYRL